MPLTGRGQATDRTCHFFIVIKKSFVVILILFHAYPPNHPSLLSGQRPLKTFCLFRQTFRPILFEILIAKKTLPFRLVVVDPTCAERGVCPFKNDSLQMVIFA